MFGLQVCVAVQAVCSQLWNKAPVPAEPVSGPLPPVGLVLALAVGGGAELEQPLHIPSTALHLPPGDTKSTMPKYLPVKQDTLPGIFFQ